MNEVKKEKVKRNRDWKGIIEKYIFFLVILIVPVSQFCIYYVGANLNTVKLSFQKFDDSGVFVWNGLGNYRRFFQLFTNDNALKYAFRNSMLLYLSSLVVSMPISIVISYYLFLKIPFHGVFKVLLMLPQIISAMVFVCIFRSLYSDGLVEVFGLPANSMLVAPSQFNIMLIYNVFFSLAGHLVLYLGAMTSLDQSIMEYGELDGLGTVGKLWHIVIPGIYPTIVVFMMTGFAAFFTNQGPIYNFFGAGAKDESYTLGYWLFLMVQNTAKPPVEYPLAATSGVIFTCVAAPLVLLFRYLLERFGPRED